MLTVEAVIILHNGPEQNETVVSHYFMESRTKQLHHIILWRTEQNSCVTLFYGTEPVPTVLYLHDWHDIVANTALCVELL